MTTPNVTIVRTGTSYPTIQAAVAASQKGDTLNIQGTTDGTFVTYNEAEMNVDWDLNFVVVGNALSAIAQPYNSATGTWRAVSKGLFVIGQTGTYPHVVFNGLHITQCSASINNTGEVKGSGWGLVIPIGAPLQTGDGNGAGIRLQSGDLTFENGLIDYCQDGILGQPFVWGTGNLVLANSTFRWCGTGLGQQHNLYIGRVKTATITGCTSDHSLAGQNIKSRAVTTTVTGCTLGSADADDFSNNQLQCIEGTLVASGNTITKPPKSTNPFPIEIGGVVPMYPDSTITITDNTFNDQYGVVALVWNWFPVPVTVSGLAVTSVKAAAPPVFNGLGTFTGVTFNGASVPDGSGSICQALTNLQNDRSITDLSGATGPQTVTLATDTAFIGGPGVLSATSILNMSGVQVIGGPGGVDINVSPPGGGVSFANHPGDAPSTVYISNPQNIFSNSLAAPGAGDQITVDKNGGSYVLVSGQGAVINHSNNEPGAAGHFEMKQSYDGIIPEGTLVSRGGVGAPIFIDNAGTLKLTGTVGTANFNAYSPTGSPAPAVMIFDNVWSGVNYGGVFTGGAFNIDQSGTHAGALVNSYSDAFCVNVYQPTTGNWEFTSLLNDILDFGPSVGATAVTTPANYLEGVAFAVVTGSGASSLSVNSPGLIQVIGGYNDGGAVTVTNYNAVQAPVVPIALLDVTASAPVHSGSTWTLTLSNGTVLTLPNGVTPNLTLPTGANDLTVAAPNVSGLLNVAKALGATVTDAYAAATVGFIKAKVTGVTGATVAFGTDGVFVGTWTNFLAALAAATITPTAATGAYTLTVFNQAGYSQSATATVAGVGLVLNAPASIELNSGTVCAIPGLSVTDAAAGTVTVGITATGTATPATTTGSVSAVNTALAGAQYGSGLVAGTDTVVVSASDNLGNTVTADIAVKVDWSPAWNDIALSVPATATIAAGGTLSLSGVTIADALATEAGVNDMLLVTNSTGTLLSTSGSPAALQTAVRALGVSEPTVGSDSVVVQVGNPASFTASGTIAVTVNAGVVNWPATGGAQGPYTSSGTTYNCTGVPMVTTTITGSGNVFNCGTDGSITLTDNSGGNTLSPPTVGEGRIVLTNGSQWTTETFDLRTLLTSAGYVSGAAGPAAYLQVAQEGANAHLQVKNAGGAWVDKLTLNGATATLTQILAQSIIPT